MDQIAQNKNDDSKRGLYQKYNFKCEHADGSPVDPAARYFVLRYDNDPAAQLALLCYAQQIKNKILANDLREEIYKYLEDVTPVTDPKNLSWHQEMQDIVNDSKG